MGSITYRRFFLWLILPVICVMAIYYPIGANFGLPNAGQVVSALNTDALEALEFFRMIPLWQYFVPFGVAGLLFGVHRLLRFFQVRCFELPAFGLVLAAAMMYFAGDFLFYTQGVRYLKEVTSGMRELTQAGNIVAAWHVTDVSPKYKNYVLVVGESNRRDYMHAYGYPVRNTPFMENRGRLLEGFTTVADYTIPSLQKALTMTVSGESVNYAKSLIDAANLAGFATAWYSNQGHIDKKNTPITALANRAQTHRWVKSGVRATENTSDRELLSLLEEDLSKDDGKPHLIVLHLMGSHSSVCDRIHEPFARPAVGSDIEDAYCYETTMRQTDYFLKSAVDVLKNAGETYSLLYFADHGVSHNRVAGRLVMNHANPADHHRDVPLFQVSSDDEMLVRYKARRFSSNLTEGALAWLGIVTEPGTSCA